MYRTEIAPLMLEWFRLPELISNVANKALRVLHLRRYKEAVVFRLAEWMKPTSVSNHFRREYSSLNAAALQH